VSPSSSPPLKDPTTWSGFGQFSVIVATTSDELAQVEAWLHAEHRLGPRQPAGRFLTQVVHEDGVPVAVLQWGSCGCFLKARDAFIGWPSLLCAKRRNLIVNNVRFLVLKATNRTNLAGKALAHATKVLSAQWHEAHGYEPLLAETFTDADGSAQGTCYKASNWQLLGQTKGFSRVSADFYEANSTPKITIPGYDTFRRLLNRLDLEAFAQVLSVWLSEHRGALPAHLAIDGKTIRSTLGTIVTLCDTEEKVPVAIAAAPCGGELEAARQLLARESTCLLNAVVSSDALHTNNENARLIVMEKGGDYIPFGRLRA